MRAVYKIFLYVLIIAVALFSCSCGDESSELQETTVTQVIPSTKATEAQTTELTTVQETTKKLSLKLRVRQRRMLVMLKREKNCSS